MPGSSASSIPRPAKRCASSARRRPICANSARLSLRLNYCDGLVIEPKPGRTCFRQDRTYITTCPWSIQRRGAPGPPESAGDRGSSRKGRSMARASLPAIAAGESGLSRYLTEIRKFPMLAPDEEYMLAKRYKEHGDRDAAHRLVTSHLRLVAKIAMGYRGYGLPIGEVISEGNVGLMQAVKKFDPDKGFRLATYAMWWIRASIQEYILRSWSLVKMGTTAAQKKLFFNLRKMKGEIAALEEGDLKPDQVTHIASKLGVPEEDVISMNRRLAGDASLNAPVRAADAESGEWQESQGLGRPSPNNRHSSPRKSNT